MGYFFSHLIYVIIAAVVIALIAFLAVVMGEKNDAERNVNDERCNFNCDSCANRALCHKEEKREKQRNDFE